MSLKESLMTACAVQIKFANREDPELQQLRSDRWQAVEDRIELMIDKKIAEERKLTLQLITNAIDDLTAPKKLKRG